MGTGAEPFELAGGDPAVLLIHGFTGTPWEVRPVAEALHACGYACSGPLLPGHGCTPRELSSKEWQDWAGAVDAAVENLRARHRRVVLVGMSLGGLLALNAAVRHQHRGVVGVVTLACALRLSPLTERFLAAATMLGARMPHAFLAKPPGRDDHDARLRAENPGYQTNPLRSARQILVGQRTVRAALPDLRVPLLALHGMLDRTALLAGSLELVSGVGSPEAALVVLPRSGHLITVDHDRAEVARQVCAFVGRIAPRLDITPT